MRNVLFIYRVLLPPMVFLFLGCLGHYVAADQRHQPLAVSTPKPYGQNSPLNTGVSSYPRNFRLHKDVTLGHITRSWSKSTETREERGTVTISTKNNRKINQVNAITNKYLKTVTSVMKQIIRSIRKPHNDVTKPNRLIAGKLQTNNPAFSPNVIPNQYKIADTMPHDGQRVARSIDGRMSKNIHLQAPETLAPEYMIHLYHLLEGTHYHLLRNTIVTSLININNAEGRYEENLNETSFSLTLVFNFSSVNEDEIIQYAEIRLFVLPSCNNPDTCKCSGQLEIHETDISAKVTSLKAIKNFNVVNGTWESVNVTSPVHTWVVPGIKVFEIVIKYDASKDNASMSNVTVENNKGKEPLLVVFSKKAGLLDRNHHGVEKREAISSAREIEYNLFDQISTNEMNNNIHYFQGLLNAVKTMEQTVHKPVHYTSHDWKASTGYKNGDLTDYTSNLTFQNTVGESLEPSENLLRNKILRNSSLVNVGESASDSDSGESEEEKPDPVVVARMRRHAKARYKRHLDVLFTDQHVAKAHSRFKRNAKKSKRNICRRHELYIEFKDIKWDKSILFPEGYQAFECIGKCYFPISAHLSPTKHAIIQTLLHTSYPDRATRACCVPTRLEPISILYYDHNANNSIRYEYTYEGMVAAECGCR